MDVWSQTGMFIIFLYTIWLVRPHLMFVYAMLSTVMDVAWILGPEALRPVGGLGAYRAYTPHIQYSSLSVGLSHLPMFSFRR